MSAWTPERRARMAEVMAERVREWEPWQKSTGPKTPKGKRKASRNGRKPKRVSKAAAAEFLSTLKEKLTPEVEPASPSVINPVALIQPGSAELRELEAAPEDPGPAMEATGELCDMYARPREPEAITPEPATPPEPQPPEPVSPPFPRGMVSFRSRPT